MRLLHTRELYLDEFFDDRIPGYAILSHRWEEEISLQDFKKGRRKNAKGYQKILAFCGRAASEGHDWCWIDTCCIDKKSSAELSEAINSMWRWYSQAVTCFVYLSDVHIMGNHAHGPSLTEAFESSAWFTRSWTLQELLAPKSVKFYDDCWKFIGDKSKLEDELVRVTGIDRFCLRYPQLIPTKSIARRMCWAAERKASRAEDMAYSLLGLFDINMPLMYGEGAPKAFYRLQLELLKMSTDESIFAWHDEDRSTGRLMPSVLAPSVSCFRGSGSVYETKFFSRTPWVVTNKGLQFSACETRKDHGSFVAKYSSGRLTFRVTTVPLNCSDERGKTPMVILFTDVDDSLKESRLPAHRINGVVKVAKVSMKAADGWTNIGLGSFFQNKTERALMDEESMCLRLWDRPDFTSYDTDDLERAVRSKLSAGADSDWGEGDFVSS